MKGKSLYLCTLSILFGLTACGGTDQTDSATYTMNVAVESAAGRDLQYGALWIYLPNKATTSAVNVQGIDGRILDDNAGNRQYAVTLDQVPVGYSAQMTIKFQSEVLQPEQTTTPERYVQPEPLIEADATEIVQKARALQGVGVTQSVGKIRDAIAELTVERAANADTDAAIRGAKQTLTSGQAAVPADLRLLEAALLRAMDIPSRLVAGFVDQGDGALTTAEMTIWTEYYDGVAWRPLVDGAKPIAFRVFASASEIETELNMNFYRAVGLSANI
ncbi:MAG: transglutaminase domain-containing protein [Pseudomonadota bacterium]